MATNAPVCQMCEHRKITKPATEFCPQCESLLCDECKEFHDISPTSKQHVTISLSELNTLGAFIPFKEPRCEDHIETFQLLCQQHDQMLCLSCLKSHSSCKDVVALSEVVAGIKDSELFREAETSLSESLANMTSILKILDENHDSADDDKEQTKREVDAICDKVVNRIREFQTRLHFKVDETSKEVKSSIFEASEDLKNKKTKTTELQDQLNSVKTYGSNIQIYKALREIMNQTQKYEEQIHALLDAGKAEKVQLSLSINNEVNRFLEVEQIATIHPKKVPVNFRMKKAKENQAQIIQPRKQPSWFDELKLDSAYTFTHQCGDLTGLSILPDGRILLCDYNNINPIAVVDESGKLVSSISVPGKHIFDVAVIDENEIAVTSCFDESVSILDIQSSGITRTITTDNRCYGITYHDQHLYCCVYWKGIIKMSVITGRSSLFYKTCLPTYSYITNHNNKLIFTSREKNTVTCCDTEGQEIWKFGNPSILSGPNPSILSGPYGITVDIVGNIFVSERANGSVVMLSEDGKKSRRVLNEDDGLNFPQVVCYDTVRHRLLVGNIGGTS